MAKTIVFCADGTWNGPGQGDTDEEPPNATNVLKLFDALDGTVAMDSLRLRDEQEKSLTAGETVVQIAKYLHGVGDSQNKLVQALGGGFGAGIISRIVRGYTFISRNWEVGDRIMLTGFSRGAYTVRALASMIGTMGLLDATKMDLSDKDAAYRAGTTVWTAYRTKAGQGNGAFLDKLDAIVADLPAFLSRDVTAPLVTGVRLAAVGVWDTVGSLGIPAYLLPSGTDEPFNFIDTRLPAAIDQAFHAVATDEERLAFIPTLWDADPRAAQYLFPGAHSDVGGGYVEAGLAECALGWMMGQFKNLGVAFAREAPEGDPLGVAHQSWRASTVLGLGHKPRSFPSGVLRYSSSLSARIAGPPVAPDPNEPKAPYTPASLVGYCAA